MPYNELLYRTHEIWDAYVKSFKAFFCLFCFLLLLLFYLSFLYFGGASNKTIIPLTLIEYEMSIANSYPTSASGMIVPYRIFSKRFGNISGEFG